MNLSLQKRLAADVLDCSEKRVKFDPEYLHDIDEAITKEDIRDLIADDIIMEEQKQGVSRVRAKHRQKQRSKGRQNGDGSRKGTQNARKSQKQSWAEQVRAQRDYIKSLKEDGEIDNATYRKLYNMIKGGYFRSKRHIKLILEERDV